MIMESSTLPKPTFRKGRVLNHKERELILNVYKYFSIERDNDRISFSFSDVIARASSATGISRSTVRRITHKGEETGTPGKDRKRGRKIQKWSGLDASLVRKTVHSFYKKRQLPTLSAIKHELESVINYTGSLTKLRRQLVALGFVYRRRHSKSKILRESTEIFCLESELPTPNSRREEN